MQLQFNLLAWVVGSCAILAVGALAWRRNFHSRAVRSFFIATVAFAIWLLTNYFETQNYSLGTIDFITRLTYLSGLWLLVATWYFCISFPTERRPSWWVRLALLTILLGGSVFSMSPLVVDHISYQAHQLIISPGSTYWLYGAILAATIVASMLHLRSNYLGANRLQRNQIRYVAFGILMGTSLSIIFDVFLVLLDPVWGSALVNLGITLLSVIFLGYGFIRHRYTDVHRLAAWIFTYSVCTVSLIVFLVATNIAANHIYPNSTNAQTISLLVVASLAVFILQPISRWTKQWADQLFNVGWYDNQTLLNSLGTMLAGELYLEPLLTSVLQSVCSALQVVNGELQIDTGDSTNRTVRFGDWADHQPPIDVTKLPNTKDITIVDELSADDPTAQALSEQSIRVSVPLQTRGRRVGYLLLGIKQSGDIFSEQDINILRILANQLAVAIVSVQSYEQISRFNTRLQQEVAEATADLREAHRKLQLDDRMKTEFIILTSHNLRTPLSIIKGYISMLEESQLTETQHQLINSMTAGVERLSRLTEDLLAIDSIISGNQITLKPIRAEEIIIPLVKEIADLAKTKKLKFVTNIALDDVMIKADPGRLSSAIRNLLNNACKFTEQGSVTFSAVPHGSKLDITVADTGIGISKEELPNLFSKFHRATDALTYNYEGVGIGLYLTNLIVKEHGGHINVTSQLHKGSTFTITLPLSHTTTSDQLL